MSYVHPEYLIPDQRDDQDEPRDKTLEQIIDGDIRGAMMSQLARLDSGRGPTTNPFGLVALHVHEAQAQELDAQHERDRAPEFLTLEDLLREFAEEEKEKLVRIPRLRRENAFPVDEEEKTCQASVAPPPPPPPPPSTTRTFTFVEYDGATGTFPDETKRSRKRARGHREEEDEPENPDETPVSKRKRTSRKGASKKGPIRFGLVTKKAAAAWKKRWADGE
jgi:hypothetical protein